MNLQFKHQRFQADAAKAVVDVFAGQPYLTRTYLMDQGGFGYAQMEALGVMSPVLQAQAEYRTMTRFG